MSKYISNSEVMALFKKADKIKLSETDEEQMKRKVKAVHDKIVVSMSFMVYYYAKPYRNFSNYEDLIQEGFVGLIRAVDRFKWQMFPNFFVYSERWMLNGIKRGASRFDIVYNPDKSRVLYSSQEDVLMEDEFADTPEDEFLKRERHEVIGTTLSELNDRDGDIVMRMFGLGDHDKQSLRKIAPSHDISHERVRQIKNSVVSKLRKNSRLLELR